MFEKYDPRKSKLLKVMNENGQLLKSAEGLPLLSDEELKKAYEIMILTREADLWAVSLNRQGRMPTYPPVIGQEANAVGAALALRQDDWFVQAFREMGGLIVRGVPLSQQYLVWLGNEVGGKMPIEKYHVLPVSVPIASQLTHGVGLAYAEKYKKTDRVSIAFVGDGGTSEGDFHEALNFASVWEAPAILYIQNNQWAISVPRKKQTRAVTLAEKAFAYGLEGVQVDGNDLQAVYAAVSLAAEKARKGGGPTLIEGVTYRLGAHTTADDPTRYRSDEEVEQWKGRDPLIRLEKYLKAKKMISDSEIESMRKESKKKAQDAFKEAENYPEPAIEEGYQYQFAQMPDILKKQLDRRKELDQKAAALTAV